MGKNKLFKSLDSLATEIMVAEIMVKDIKTLKSTDTVDKAVSLMAKHSISGIIVCDNDKPVGIVSEGDIIKKVFNKEKNPKKIKINTIMTKNLHTITPQHNIGETSVIMKNKSVSKLPVMHNKKIVGVVTKSDLLEKLNEIYYQNRRLLFLTVVIMVQMIAIVLLIIGYLNK